MAADNDSPLVKFPTSIDYTKAPSLKYPEALGVIFLADRNTPVKPTGVREVDFFLINFDTWTLAKGALERLTAMGMRPATIRELLAFDEAYPDEVKKGPIVALGSAIPPREGFGGPSMVLYLDSIGVRTMVTTKPTDVPFAKRYRFIATWRRM